MWNTEKNYNWRKGENYDAFIFQTFTDGTGFMFTENIPINLFTRASHLIASASAALFFTLI